MRIIDVDKSQRRKKKSQYYIRIDKNIFCKRFFLLLLYKPKKGKENYKEITNECHSDKMKREYRKNQHSIESLLFLSIEM